MAKINFKREVRVILIETIMIPVAFTWVIGCSLFFGDITLKTAQYLNAIFWWYILLYFMWPELKKLVPNFIKSLFKGGKDV